MIIANQLSDYRLFAGLSDHDLSVLTPSFSKRTFAKDAYLYYPENLSVNIYLAESGLIRMFFTNTAGQEFLLDLVGPRSVVGIPLLREDQSRIGGVKCTR